MDTDRRNGDRWMLLAGPLFTVLAVVGVILVGSTPGEKDPADEIIKHFKDNDTQTLAGVFLWGPAAAALLVFVSRLRAGIDDRARAARSLLVAGGTLYATGIVIGTSVTLAQVVAADGEFKDASQALNVLNAALWVPVVIGIATMLLGAGLAVLRTGLLPTWLGWVAVVVGVVSLFGPGGFLGFFVAPLWVGLAGILLYTRKDEVTVVTA
jgi:hypothetical protein